MKKLLQFLPLVILSLALIICVSACDKNTNADTDHHATEGKTEANTENSIESTEASTDAPVCTHESSEWVVDKAATCSSVGSSQKKCTSCGAVLESVTLEKLAHTEVIVNGKAPTCSEKGLSSGKQCSVCGEFTVTQNEIGIISHTLAISTTAKQPTCDTDGCTIGISCSVCSAVITPSVAIPALGHKDSDWITDTVAEVGKDGSKHKECTECKEIRETAVISAITADHVHAGEYWSAVKRPTCTEEGLSNLICSCGTTLETRVLAKADHVEEDIPGRAPTCKATGLTTGKKCTVCGEVTFAQSIIALADHVKETVLGTTPTCTEGGTSDGEKCSYCGITVTAQLPLPPKGHSFDKSVCTVCGEIEPYGIWIVDGLGNPMSDIIVKLMKDGEQIKMYPYSGSFISFDVEVGEYQVELDLSQLNEEYVYDVAECLITPENRSANIRLFKTAEDYPESLFVSAPLEKDYTAQIVDVGSYKIDLVPGEYNFFVFTPKKTATYTFTYECDSELKIGYHGGTFFVQGNDLSSDTTDLGKYENGIFCHIYSSNIGGSYVFSIKSTSAKACIFNIKNAGTPGTRLEDEPWTPYLEDEKKVEEQLASKPEGTFTEIDLTDLELSAVFNKADGYYHLGSEDGPVIYIDLTSNSPYISSIQTICANQRMGAYIYDINGKVTEKRSYNELFHQYGMPSDTTPVNEPIRIPLTAKLAEAIISFGENNSWWAENSEANIFTPVLMTTPYNRDFAWLLYCGIYK